MWTLLIIVCIVGIVWTLILYIGLDDPFPKIARGILILILIWALLGVAGIVPFPAKGF